MQKGYKEIAGKHKTPLYVIFLFEVHTVQFFMIENHCRYTAYRFHYTQIPCRQFSKKKPAYEANNKPHAEKNPHKAMLLVISFHIRNLFFFRRFLPGPEADRLFASILDNSNDYNRRYSNYQYY